MKKLISVEEAVAKVKDGMTVMIGGFLSNGTPNAIVNALAQSEVKNLILIVILLSGFLQEYLKILEVLLHFLRRLLCIHLPLIHQL